MGIILKLMDDEDFIVVSSKQTVVVHFGTSPMFYFKNQFLQILTLGKI